MIYFWLFNRFLRSYVWFIDWLIIYIFNFHFFEERTVYWNIFSNFIGLRFNCNNFFMRQPFFEF